MQTRQKIVDITVDRRETGLKPKQRHMGEGGGGTEEVQAAFVKW